VIQSLMTKTFRPWDVDQDWLLPQSMHEFVPPGHVAHFIRDTVSEALDLSNILAAYSDERGYPPYHPTMMVALLLYAYSQGGLLLSANRARLRGADGFYGGHRAEPARFTYHQRVS
jgi:hypothetical protein